MMPNVRSYSKTMKYLSVIDGTLDGASLQPAAINTSVTGVTENTKQKIVLLDIKNQRKNDEDRWKQPHWKRGFLWSHGAPSRTPSAMSTESASPLPSIPMSELSNIMEN